MRGWLTLTVSQPAIYKNGNGNGIYYSAFSTIYPNALYNIQLRGEIRRQHVKASMASMASINQSFNFSYIHL